MARWNGNLPGGLAEAPLCPVPVDRVPGEPFADRESPADGPGVPVKVPKNKKGPANDGPLAIGRIEFIALAESLSALHGL